MMGLLMGKLLRLSDPQIPRLYSRESDSYLTEKVNNAWKAHIPVPGTG